MHNETDWKTIAVYMLFALQGLFLLSTTWDFFLTVLVTTSTRAGVFAALGGC
jgi:hypothetical protein